MEPRIQYAKTSDGVSIAYWTLGEGMPFVHMPTFPFSHLQLEWQIPECRRWYERLAKTRKLVRYDGRGSGLSQRDVADNSPQARLLDLAAVVDRLTLETFALFGYGHSGLLALFYTLRYPQRVSHLLLWHSYTSVSDFAASGQIRAMAAMLGSDWDLFTETTAHALLGWGEGDPARRFAALMRASVTREQTEAAFTAFSGVDVTSDLGTIETPTLVLHRTEVPWLSVDRAVDLAARIPNARLALLEGASSAPWLGDIEEELRAIDEFVEIPHSESAVASPTTPPSGTAVILFADIADSTALTERLGDEAFRERARELDAALRTVIRDHGGTPVEGKLLGDGVLAVFTSARQAIEAALRCGKAGSHRGLPLHLGVHAGDVIREENNVYGGAVNIASRISALSAPGEVLVSDTVRGLARTSAGVTFEDRGEQSLKGVSEPQRLWALRSQV